MVCPFKTKPFKPYFHRVQRIDFVVFLCVFMCVCVCLYNETCIGNSMICSDVWHKYNG